MNKRSAIVVALGLVAALVIGGVGFAVGMTGPAPSVASVRQPAPTVRTIHRTVTVHRPASTSAFATGTPSATAAGSGATTDGWDDEGWDDEDGWEDDHEGDDHGSDHEGDDHEGDDHEGDDHEGQDD